MINPKTVLITGAGGYIGPSVVRALCDKGLRVVATDRKTFDCDERAKSITIDFEAIPSEAAIMRHAPDIVLHLAWSGGFQHDDPGHLDALPRHYSFLVRMLDAGVVHLAAMGTMHEIGYWEGSIDDATPANPASLYGIAKNALRQAMFVEARKRGVTLQWLRAFYILGDDARNRSLFSKILAWEAEGRASFPMNSGKNRYDFIQIDDLGAQIATAVAQTEIDGIINCCSGRPIEIREAVDAFIARHGLKIRPAFGEYPDRPYDSPGVWGDPQKINSIMSAAAAA
jgi:dTDP-6-deoxy-L-talose 4-dehydrogenase (NAD+)